MRYRLIVMRHAKSDWDTDAPTDHARPLNKRGRKDAPRIAARIVELGWQPDLILSSDSQRTRETYELMCEAFDPPPTAEFLDSFYHAGLRELAGAAASIADDVTTLLVLGHNPGWQTALHTLTGEYTQMTTANAALVQIEADSWATAITREKAWELVDVIRPKEL